METKIADSLVLGLLTAEELGAQLGLSTSTIYRRRSLGESLPRAVRVGPRGVRWRQVDIDAWIEAQLESEGA